jgi:hypothetical protein
MLTEPAQDLVRFKEPNMSALPLAASTFFAVGAGLLLAAAYYTEAHRAPDQP